MRRALAAGTTCLHSDSLLDVSYAIPLAAGRLPGMISKVCTAAAVVPLPTGAPFLAVVWQDQPHGPRCSIVRGGSASPTLAVAGFAEFLGSRRQGQQPLCIDTCPVQDVYRSL